MLVNPLLIVISITLILFVLFFYIVNRPKKPLLTLVLILLLIIFLSCTMILNNALTPNQGYLISGNSMKRVLPFIVSVSHPTIEQCEQAFEVYKTIDICLFVATIIAMIAEVWNLFLRPNKKQEK
jgi:putative effector of murein hydrolase